jgi:serpin B
VGTDRLETVNVVRSGNQFAFDLYGRLRASRGNLFFSPTSILTALAMTYAGAAGDTAAEIAKTLHFEIPKDELNRAMRALLASWKSNEKVHGIQLNVANRLWGQVGESFLPAYLAVTRDDYGAELARLDFADGERARQTINQWVLDQTAGKIKDVIASADQLAAARLVITNAIYFKGNWTEPFKAKLTKEEDFRLSAEQTIKAPLMHARRHFRYAALDGLQILELPYANRSFSMIVLLPEDPDALADLESRLTVKNWWEWTQELRQQEVIVYLPRFKTTAEFDLAGVLASMGLTSVFNSRADFSQMNGKRDLFILQVLHKAFVDVNEEGTEAAAATALMAGTKVMQPTAPPVFRADHPFVFAIRDNRNGANLFLGRLADPTRG